MMGTLKFPCLSSGWRNTRKSTSNTWTLTNRTFAGLPKPLMLLKNFRLFYYSFKTFVTHKFLESQTLLKQKEAQNMFYLKMQISEYISEKDMAKLFNKAEYKFLQHRIFLWQGEFLSDFGQTAISGSVRIFYPVERLTWRHLCQAWQALRL